VSRDLIWLLVSYLYVGVVLAVGVAARAGGRRSPEVTRKIIHVGVGSWIIPTTLLFESPVLAAVPPLTFILLNLLSYRLKLVKAMEEGDRNPGTIYFPVAFVLLTFFFWPGILAGVGRAVGLAITDGGLAGDRWARLPVAAGIMTMAWGDAAAALVGRPFGRRRFGVPGGGTKSLEGSVAFVLFAALGIEAAALALGMASGMSAGAALAAGLRPALAAAILSAGAEAVTPFGLDNLTAPLVTALVTRWLT
jgi:phytol kinase